MPEDHGYRAPRWAWAVATGLGSGRMRPAPGTWGSAAALAAWCLLLRLAILPLARWGAAHGQGVQVLLEAGVELIFLLLIGGLTWISVRASDLVVRETGTKDPGFIVADEWVGMWITLWPSRWSLALLLGKLSAASLPALAPVLALSLGIPFLVFRVLDIWKPWPVAQIQDLPGGQGIVADDLVAGLYGIPFAMLLLPAALACLR